MELGDEELEGADGFEFAEGLLGIGGRAFPLAVGVHRGFALVVAEVAEGEIAGAAEEPGARVGDVFPVGVEFEEGVLDDILGGLALA